MSVHTKVTYRDVGREKRAWSTTFPGEMCESMVEAIWIDVRKKGGLASRDLDVSYDPKASRGAVIVGGFRVVGSFTVEPS